MRFGKLPFMRDCDRNDRLMPRYLAASRSVSSWFLARPESPFLLRSESLSASRTDSPVCVRHYPHQFVRSVSTHASSSPWSRSHGLERGGLRLHSPIRALTLFQKRHISQFTVMDSSSLARLTLMCSILDNPGRSIRAWSSSSGRIPAGTEASKNFRNFVRATVHTFSGPRFPPWPPGFSTGPAMVSGRGLRRPAAAVAISLGLWPGPCPRPWAHDPFEEGGSGRLAWHRRFRAAWGRVGYRGLGVQQHEQHRRTLRRHLARSLHAWRQGSAETDATADALRVRPRERSSTRKYNGHNTAAMSLNRAHEVYSRWSLKMGVALRPGIESELQRGAGGAARH
jgi:hypothetical protein